MTDARASSKQLVETYLSAKGRERCYAARDQYFRCLDEWERNKGTQVSEKVTDCDKEKQEYTSSCLSSWVRYFNQQRKIAKYKGTGFVPKQD
eukprot:jgi/Galph1/769/GphlegSOOS_G5554.1